MTEEELSPQAKAVYARMRARRLEVQGIIDLPAVKARREHRKVIAEIRERHGLQNDDKEMSYEEKKQALIDRMFDPPK